MMPVFLHDKGVIEKALRADAFLHLYEIGDLDDRFWPYTTWYALSKDEPREIVLLYTGQALPNFLALTPGKTDRLRELIMSAIHLLPRRFYAHLTEGLATALEQDYRISSHGIHSKMALTDSSRLEGVSTSEVVPLAGEDGEELQRLYELSYPGHWFDPRMLETGQYFGIRRRGELVSVAGIHVYSPLYRVAAVGNVTTRPAWRGRGLAKAVCARLCHSLRENVDHIGLNVKADNVGGIRCYEGLGFRHLAYYEECSLNAL
jgi:GNAT superfamily N-acetyltransferase